MGYAIVDIETVALPDAMTYLEDEPVMPPSNYRDQAKISEYVKSKTAERISRCSLDPDLCRIVALGWMFTGETAPTVITCINEEYERMALAQFWRATTTIGIEMPVWLVTFNGLRFDLPIVQRRSDYLRVPYRPLNLDRYRTHHVDLWARLTFNGTIGTSHGLRFYAKRFGIPLSLPDIDGSDIAALVAAGDWEAIQAHCADDIQVTYAIAKQLGVFSPVLSYAR